MSLTRNTKEAIVARIEQDAAFARALLDEALTLFLNGESDTARLILRDLVSGVVGFEALAEEVGRPSKSLQRMLSPSGNPGMDHLSAIIGAVRKALTVDFDIKIINAA